MGGDLVQRLMTWIWLATPVDLDFGHVNPHVRCVFLRASRHARGAERGGQQKSECLKTSLVDPGANGQSLS